MADTNTPKYEDTIPLYNDTTAVASNQPVSEQPESGMGEALLRGAASGATFGFGDRIEAGAKAALSDQTYDDILKSVRERNRKVAVENPVADTIGKIGGNVGSILLGGGLLGAGAKAAGLGAEAASAAGALGLGGESLGTIGGTIRGGATLGGLGGLGETEDLTKPMDVVKDIAGGAAGGAVGGTVLHGGGKVLSKAAKFASELPVIEEGVQAAKMAFQGKSLKTPETREGLSNRVEGLVDQINKMQEHISGNYDKVLDVPITIKPETLQGASADTLNVLGKMIQEKEAGQLQARDIDNAVKAMKDKIDHLSNTGTYEEKQAAIAVKNEMQTLLNSNLDDESKKLLELANKQNYLLSNAKANLGFPERGVRAKAGSQMEQAQYENLVRGLTDDFLNSSKGNASDTNKLKKAFDYMKQVEDSSVNLENPLAPETTKISDELSTKAKEYRIAELGSKRSEFGGISKGGYSLKGIPIHAGQVIGTAAKATTEMAQAPIAIARNLSDAIASQSDTAASMVNTMKNSADATTKKAGELLNNVMMEPSMDKRRALMFTLAQQPWFRSVAAKHLGTTKPGEESGQ